MSATDDNEWSPRQRRELLDTAGDLRQRLEEIELTGTGGPDDRERRNRLLESLGRIRAAYRDGLPVRALARCPHSEALLEHSIDDQGLDGLWWDYENPARRVESNPSTFFALTGAVRLAGSVKRAPFLCKPGPEVPYVIPRILEHRDIRAVVLAMPIGHHTGYAISYFADPIPGGLRRANAWGANEYRVVRPDGSWGWNAVPEVEAEFDFELGPWIEAGKLTWIAPGDSTMTLREDAHGCPYLGLEGNREIARIEDGEVWRFSDVFDGHG